MNTNLPEPEDFTEAEKNELIARYCGKSSAHLTCRTPLFTKPRRLPGETPRSVRVAPKAEKRGNKVKACERCQTAFLPRVGTQKYCSDSCSVEASIESQQRRRAARKAEGKK